ncbi:hypothetical protein GGQ20_001841 [Salinibacter ruber]|uniref:sulfotransferase domain-containing protein n=1 Tax=Salinibacter ruber TaxID=146919 RepID=UPI002168B22B|nr:sulfotransferase domain-containing protein [Salinibacter ruber]MCS3700524.1 hypothetical protein [Salinibacter ruber]
MDVLASVAKRVKRLSTLLRRRYSSIRHLVPYGLVKVYQKYQNRIADLRQYYIPVEEKSQLRNIYHCCVWKTGSQWLLSILSDVKVYQASGLLHFHPSRIGKSMEDKATTERYYHDAFPSGRIVGPLCVDVDRFNDIEKNTPYRVFFVTRNPRDLVVSWYYSAKKTHIVKADENNKLVETRQKLRNSSKEMGLVHSIDHLCEYDTFKCMKSWASKAHNPNVHVVKFENLYGNGSVQTFRNLFEFLDIQMSKTDLMELLEAYSFERLSGRQRSNENTESHLRGGSEGEWKSHFTPVVEDYFNKKVGREIADLLGY